MNWEIKYYNQKLEEAVLNLPDGLLARYLRLTDLMIEFGPNLGAPHTKSIENGLFELRVKSQEGIARVFYCTKIGQKNNNAPFFHQKVSKNTEKRAKKGQIENG